MGATLLWLQPLTQIWAWVPALHSFLFPRWTWMNFLGRSEAGYSKKIRNSPRTYRIYELETQNDPIAWRQTQTEHNQGICKAGFVVQLRTSNFGLQFDILAMRRLWNGKGFFNWNHAALIPSDRVGDPQHMIWYWSISPMDTHERHVVPLKSFRNLSSRQGSIDVHMLCNCIKIIMIIHKTSTVYNLMPSHI